MIADMFLTVAICTRNRAASLGQTLRSLCLAEKPGRWELIVVDNGSTDSTASVCDAYACALPLRRVVEPRPGLSHARNAAVSAARGDYIVWTDDDVLVGPGWLKAYIAAFEAWPDAAVFGGKITPIFEGTPPSWFMQCRERFADALAKRDLGDDPIPLSIAGERVPFGANFAVRAAEQRRFRYDPKLGVAPVRRMLGEETEVIEAILKSGATGRWVPDAEVEHRIGPNRQTAKYLKHYYACRGRTAAFREPRPDVSFAFGAPRELWGRVARSFMQFELARFAAPPADWIENLKTYAVARGELDYWLNPDVASVSPIDDVEHAVGFLPEANAHSA
jgi:glycosyltransferase involved in cell wall biosynthesis